MQEVKLRHRGREVTERDVDFIRELVATHPEASRRKLSKILCEAWDWRQPNGELRDMVCRGLMLALHRAGLIELPPVRSKPRNNVVERYSPKAIEVDSTPLRATIAELGSLEIRQVRRTRDEALFAALLEREHYLGYRRPVGEHLKYLVLREDRPIACLAWSSAPRHLGPRDRFIAWSKEARRKNIRFLAYNTRFLILPWIEVPHLASHLLGAIARRISGDWETLYSHPIYFLETFVDPARFRGTCYRAANWIVVGRTTGRGKADQTMRPNRSIKEILVYPLTRRFRALLSEET